LDKDIDSTKSNNRMVFGPKLPYLYSLAIQQGKKVAKKGQRAVRLLLKQAS
jgi:hypothetical protein